MKTFSRALRTSDWGEGSPSNRTNDPKHKAKTVVRCVLAAEKSGTGERKLIYNGVL